MIFHKIFIVDFNIAYTYFLNSLKINIYVFNFFIYFHAVNGIFFKNELFKIYNNKTLKKHLFQGFLVRIIMNFCSRTIFTVYWQLFYALSSYLRP